MTILKSVSGSTLSYDKESGRLVCSCGSKSFRVFYSIQIRQCHLCYERYPMDTTTIKHQR